jgi:hypothetical protein
MDWIISVCLEISLNETSELPEPADRVSRWLYAETRE